MFSRGDYIGGAIMSADVSDENERRDLDLSFLDRQPVRAAEIPNLNERGERKEERDRMRHTGGRGPH